MRNHTQSEKAGYCGVAVTVSVAGKEEMFEGPGHAADESGGEEKVRESEEKR